MSPQKEKAMFISGTTDVDNYIMTMAIFRKGKGKKGCTWSILTRPIVQVHKNPRNIFLANRSIVSFTKNV